MKVEIAYAEPQQQWLLEVEVPDHATAAEAIEKSGILQKCPQLLADQLKVGVFGKLTKLERVLRDGDRIEIYRPLIADPKQVRAARAAKAES